MRAWSLRGWLFLLSLLFAVLVAGGVALTTYVIVSDGMQVVAFDTTERVASSAAALVEEGAREAWNQANRPGRQRENTLLVARAGLNSRLPYLLSGSGLTGTLFALYDHEDELIWSSGQDAVRPEQAEKRRIAVATNKITRTLQERGNLMMGLVGYAELGKVVVHTPISLPGGDVGVLDVTYVPRTESQVIDAIRFPMTVLALTTMLVIVVLVQTSMAWVLNLIAGLRRAADSIDAGRLEERLPAMGDNEIGDLARSVNRLIERLRRRADAQTRFVGDASHELATPVAGIRGYTNILRAWGADDPKVREEAIDAIDRESRRMARLTSDLLNLLHADQGLRLTSERFDLNALVRERLAVVASIHMDQGIDFEGPEEESLFMVGDADRIEDVLSILIENAGKYTPSGGRVSVSTARRRDDVVIEVKDTGVGIPPEEIAHVFDRFFRSERARAGGETGFGLGLAIAKTVVDNMGGTISAESQVGLGTTFTVVIPRGRP